MRLLLGPILLGLFLTIRADELKLEEAPEPFETSDMDLRMAESKPTVIPHPQPHFGSHEHYHPHPEPEPEPIAEPEPHSRPEPKPEPTAEPTPEPEPAIKFDNVENEDYGDVAEVLNTPDQVDDALITELVEGFLNGSIAKKAPAYTNVAVHNLINSSDYWKIDNIQPAGSIKDPEAIKTWVDGYQVEAQKIMQQVASAGWKYVANASPTTKKSLDEAEEALAQFVRSTAMQGKQFDLEAVTDPNIRRQLEFVTFEGMSALSADQFTEYNKAQAQVNILTINANVCDKDMPPPCALKKVDLDSIFYTEKDASRLAFLWNNYLSQVAGAKPAYEEIVKYSTKGAQVNGFSDAGAMWRSAFDLSNKKRAPAFDMTKQMEDVYKKIEPLYKHLHAYMRRQISGIYENAVDLSKDGPIPAHLFGSLDGGDWSIHYEKTKPFEVEDSTPAEMLMAFNTQNYTSKKMFTQAYRYLKSVGFPKLPKTVWTSSIFGRVWSRDMICNPAAAIDMRGGSDYRIKACAQLGEPDFQLAHSLLSQTYYQYLYEQQPFLFREYASPVISDAIAKVFARLASNPHYLYSQKLVPSSNLEIQDSIVINRLYKEALGNIAKIPFNLVADDWRYELFEGKLNIDKSNDRWWQLRKQYEGLRAPQPYNASNLDALIHTAISQIHSPASKDIISYVVQFQILKAICPEGVILSEGCILSEDTTEKLRKTMAMGSSINWLQALEMITGKAEIDAQPMLEYYEPLITWLLNTNEIDQVIVGWDGEGTPFSPEEIPKARSDSNSESGFVAQDRIAFPGGECVHGQECILDSRCNGTVCVCNDGLFTLELGGTISCVKDDPVSHGFVHNDDESPFSIVENTNTNAPEVTTTTRRPHGKAGETGASLPAIFVLLLTLLFVF